MIGCGHWQTSYEHSKIEGMGSKRGEVAIFTHFIAEGIIALDECTAHSDFVNCIVIEENIDGLYYYYLTKQSK